MSLTEMILLQLFPIKSLVLVAKPPSPDKSFSSEIKYIKAISPLVNESCGLGVWLLIPPGFRTERCRWRTHSNSPHLINIFQERAVFLKNNIVFTD